MRLCSDIIAWLEDFAPPESAEEWDHVGLMVGSEKDQLTGVVLALDCTPKAIEKCIKTGSNLLVTHHPLFFSSVNCIDRETLTGKMICDLIENHITVYSAHTNLDRVKGGVNDVLCETIGLDAFAPLSENAIERIGEWHNPRGLFSCVREMQAALEAPGFFINMDKDCQITTALVCGGSFDGEIISLIADIKPSIIISGEIKHHHMLELAGHQISAVALGHDTTERVILPKLKSALQVEFSDIRLEIECGLDYNKVAF